MWGPRQVKPGIEFFVVLQFFLPDLGQPIVRFEAISVFGTFSHWQMPGVTRRLPGNLPPATTSNSEMEVPATSRS